MTQPLEWRTLVRPLIASAAAVAAAFGAGCAGTPIARRGPAQAHVVSRTFAAPLAVVRAVTLDAFVNGRAKLPPPFDRLGASPLAPPRYRPDWADTFVDPGGFLAGYRTLPADDRRRDLLLDEPTGDV